VNVCVTNRVLCLVAILEKAAYSNMCTGAAVAVLFQLHTCSCCSVCKRRGVVQRTFHPLHTVWQLRVWLDQVHNALEVVCQCVACMTCVALMSVSCLTFALVCLPAPPPPSLQVSCVTCLLRSVRGVRVSIVCVFHQKDVYVPPPPCPSAPPPSSLAGVVCDASGAPEGHPPDQACSLAHM
jgi:hypothetical protein